MFTRIAACASSTATNWQSLSSSNREHFLRAIIDRVIIHPTRVEIRIRTAQFVQQLLGDKNAAAGQAAENTGTVQAYLQPLVSIECPFRHIPQGRALRLIVGNTNITTDASRQAILKAVARARIWYEQLTTGKAGSIEQLAKMHGLSARYLHVQIKLIQLSPKSIENLMTRHHSMPLSLDDLLNSIPMNWNKQVYSRAARPA